MVAFRGLKCAINCNEEALPEHSDPELKATEDDNAAPAVYVEAIPGAKFKICIDIDGNIAHHNQFIGFAYNVIIDGVVTNRLISKGFPHKTSVSHVRYTEGNVTMRRDFIFAQVSTVAAAKSKVTLADAASTGSIELKFWRVVGSHVVPSTDTECAGVKKLEQRGPIAEKALVKGSNSLKTSFGAAQPAGYREIKRDVTYFDPVNGPPYASMEFLYRTRESLELMGIIPDTTQPSETEDVEETVDADQPVEDMTREELEAFVKRQRAGRGTGETKQRIKRGIKREGIDDDELQEVSHRPVKRERVRTKGAGTLAQPVEILDLDD